MITSKHIFIALILVCSGRANGSSLGAPMVISLADRDVFGAPRAATADGQQVLVTFPETSGESFDLRAVSLEDAERPVDSDRMARR